MERILAMILRRLMNRGINAGIRKGVDMMSGDDDSPEGRKRSQSNRKNANRARQAMRITRRFGKF